MPEAPKRTRRYVLAERPAAPTGPLREGVLRYEERRSRAAARSRTGSGLPHLAVNARVVLCGAISRHDGSRGPAPLHNWFHLLFNRVRMEGFIYMDHEARFDEIEADLLPRLRDGELRSREHVVEGLTAAPAALHTLFDGTNTGKLLVRVGHS